MIKNLFILTGLSLLGIGLFFVVNRFFTDKKPVIHFTEQITSSEFTEDLLKETGSPGARTFLDLCSQCHSTPNPKRYSAEKWPDYLVKKQAFILETKKTKPEVILPKSEEMTLISTYLSEEAAK